MKIIRLLAGCMLMACMTIVLAGCKPHEERVMDRLNRLSEDIQKNSSKWGINEWADALADIEDIHYDMEDCEFTPQQMRELGRIEGQLTVIVMTEGAKKLGEQLAPFLEGAGAFMKGYKEEAESMQDYSVGEFENKEGKVIDQLNELTEQIEKMSEKWDSEDWQNAFKKVEEIHNEMSECDFSDE